MKPRSLALLSFVALLLMLSAGVAHGMPPLPAAFYGQARVGGINAAPGTLITAWIGDRPLATVAAVTWQGGSWYSLDVPGDDPDTPGSVEGGQSGDVVRFTLAGRPALETGPWRGGANQLLDLNAELSPERVFLPVILKP